MKKSILVAILVAVMLIATIGSVNAGTVTAPKTAKAGDTVTVSLNVDTAMTNGDITMTYDATKLAYKSTVAGTNMMAQTNSDVAGELIISVAGGDNTTKKIDVVFTAKEDLKSGDANVTVTAFDVNTKETLKNTSVTVAMTAKEQKPDDSNNGNNGNNGNKPNKPVDVNGNVIEEHPKTGTPVYIAVVAVIVIAAGAVLAIRKNK